MAFRVNFDSYCKSDSTIGEQSFLNTIGKTRAFSKEVSELVIQKLSQLSISHDKKLLTTLQVQYKTTKSESDETSRKKIGRRKRTYAKRNSSRLASNESRDNSMGRFRVSALPKGKVTT